MGAALATVAGDIRRLGPGRVLVFDDLAAERGLTVGSSVPVDGRTYRVVAVVRYAAPRPAAPDAPPAGRTVALSDGDFTAVFPTERGHLAEVTVAPGVEALGTE